MTRAGAVAWLFTLTGCAHACGEDHVARFELVVQQVERDRAAAVGRWQSAEIGARLHMGDGVRTGTGSRAELALVPSGRLIVQAGTALRFSAHAPGQARELALETGAVEIEAAGAPIVLSVESGAAHVERGARVRVRREGGSARFDVSLGRVKLEGGGTSQTLAAGQGYELSLGAARVEAPAPAPPPAKVVVAQPDAGAALSAVQPEALRFELGPSVVDLTLTAGQSAVVHDPSPPLRLAITSTACRGELAIETSRGSGQAAEQRVRGAGRAAISLRAGRHLYRVRCFEGAGLVARAAAQGSVNVVRDAAERPLPARAPQATVDADGRRYTVRYQNLLPALTLRWPEAPLAPRYSLELAREGGAPRTRVLSAASAALRSGELAEGGYAFRFSAGSVRSPEGKLRVEFDNAARTAYLSAPRDRAFLRGRAVRVQGAALAQAEVELQGARVHTDAQGRFDAQATLGDGAQALVLRVQHPAAGVHYFLRRAADADR